MNSSTIDITVISGSELARKKTDILEKIVYNNFIHLASSSGVSHTTEHIHKLFNSQNSFFMSASIDGALIGYVLGEYTNLNHINDADYRNVCYISYIYVCDKYRGKSIATNMMRILLSDNTNNKINGWMLIFDTHKQNLRRFYSKLGFKPDILHKTHSQHEVYFKQKIY